jgi:general secretion pathway protein L
VRQGEWQGFTLDLIIWEMQCQAFSQQKTGEDLDEDNVLIQSYSILPTSEHLNIQSMPEELPMALMAKHYSNRFNLLQGDYKVKDSHGANIKQWYWVAAVALFALLLNLSFKGVQLWQVNAKQTEIEAQIIAEYKKAFPKTKRVRIATIKSQLNQKLAQLGGASDSDGFLAMLAKITPAFTKVPALKPESLKFDGKRQELRLQATANSYQIFEQFKSALEQENLTVKQGAQNNQGDKVTGSFSIRNENKATKTSSKNKVSRGASK